MGLGEGLGKDGQSYKLPDNHTSNNKAAAVIM